MKIIACMVMSGLIGCQSTSAQEAPPPSSSEPDLTISDPPSSNDHGPVSMAMINPTSPLSMILIDHFTGSSLDMSKWEVIGTKSPTIVDDSSSGGSGALRLSGDTTSTIQTKPLAVGTRDFTISARIRASEIPYMSKFSIGMELSDSSVVAFYANSSRSNLWRMNIDGTLLVYTSAPPILPQYINIQISRSSNKLIFSGGGTVFFSADYSTNLNGARFFLKEEASSGGTMRVDYVQLSVAP